MSVFAPLVRPLDDDPPLPRGGYRQRAAALEAWESRARTPRRNSLSAMRQLRHLSTGHSSAVRLWGDVDSMISDGFANPFLERLHACGRSEHDQNCHKQLVNLLSRECGFGRSISTIAEGSVSVTIKPSSIISLLYTQ